MAAENTQTNNTQAPDAESERQIEALIKKHREKIDAVLLLTPDEERKVFHSLGVDPDKLMSHYKELADRDAKLDALDRKATVKTAITGWLSAGAALAGTLLVRKRISGSKLIQGFTAGIAALSGGLLGTFAGSRIFSAKIRDDGKALAIESREAMERELAVAFENRDRDEAAHKNTPASPMRDAAPKVAPRDPSFAAQATADKTVAANAQSRA